MFNVGDKVKCTWAVPGLVLGAYYIVSSVSGNVKLEGAHGFWAPQWFELSEKFTEKPASKVGGFSNMLLPDDAVARKGIPVITGVLDYFPLAIAEVARLSKAGNDQHNPGKPLHWDRTKSLDHADCIGRHLIDRGTVDADGQRHSAKLAWRALALLQTELENATK